MITVIIKIFFTDLLQADASGPEFKSKFNQTETFIDVSFGKLIATGKEDSMVDMINTILAISNM